MSLAKPTWEQLNAYVDGELSAADAAAVARALADDKALAEKVATLSRLKAATQDLREPIQLLATAPERHFWGHRNPVPVMLAAFAGALAVAALFVMSPWGGPIEPPWLTRAWEVHHAWTQAEDEAPVEPVDSGLLLATFNRLGSSARLPDLGDAQLTLTHIAVESLAETGGEAVHIGYRGTRGCQVSLLVVPGGGAVPIGLARYDRDGGRGYAWRGGGNGYLLLADGMDMARLALLAKTLQRASTKQQPLDPGSRTALRQSREHSAPCLS